MTSIPANPKPERIAKRLARAGLCSRREAERLIAQGRVEVNGVTLETPAVTVTTDDEIRFDGELIPAAEAPRLWRYHKPQGRITTDHDPEGRPTIFEGLPDNMPRVVTVGRLDLNTEGLLLLTNSGELAGILEAPATGWARRYRVRAHGKADEAALAGLSDGVTVDGVAYGPIKATIDRHQGANMWLTVSLTEGKNREVRNALASIGLNVNRLIRLSYGPFQLGGLARGAVEEVPAKVMKDQLGKKICTQIGLS